MTPDLYLHLNISFSLSNRYADFTKILEIHFLKNAKKHDTWILHVHLTGQSVWRGEFVWEFEEFVFEKLRKNIGKWC